MPLLAKNKLTLRMELDSAVTFLGGCITGTLHVEATEDCNVRRIMLKYGALERYKGVHGFCKNDVPEGMLEKPKRGTWMPGDESVLHHGGCGEVRLTVGIHSFPFSLKVPTSLPPSVAPTSLGLRDGLTKTQYATSKKNIASITHMIRAEIDIPFSMFDKVQVWPVVVVKAANPAGYVDQLEQEASQDAPSLSCMNFCPALVKTIPNVFRSGDTVNFTVNLPRTIIAVQEEQGIRFRINGHISCRYEVCLVRESLVAKRRNRHCHPKKLEQVVARVSMPPLLASTTEGVINISGVEACQVVSFSSQNIMSVRYHVAVMPQYVSGVGTGVDDALRAKVPVELVHSIHNMAPITHQHNVMGFEKKRTASNAMVPNHAATIAPVMGTIVDPPVSDCSSKVQPCAAA